MSPRTVLLRLLSSPTCPPCDAVKRQILLARASLAARGRRGESVPLVELETVDVSAAEEAETAKRYGQSIPVLFVQGKEVSRGRVADAAEIAAWIERGDDAR